MSVGFHRHLLQPLLHFRVLRHRAVHLAVQVNPQQPLLPTILPPLLTQPREMGRHGLDGADNGCHFHLVFQAFIIVIGTSHRTGEVAELHRAQQNLAALQIVEVCPFFFAVGRCTLPATYKEIVEFINGAVVDILITSKRNGNDAMVVHGGGFLQISIATEGGTNAGNFGANGLLFASCCPFYLQR